jgi:hypothetical protein
MNKKLNFSVTVEFSDKITDDETIINIAKNIGRSIVEEANNGMGITPDYSDTYTIAVSIKPQFIDETIEMKIIDEKFNPINYDKS